MREYGHGNQKLVLGPWGHTDQSTRRIGDRDFGPQAAIDLQRDYLRWFDYWLKGTGNGIAKEPLVKIFVMGSNKWLEGPVYPLPETRFEKWYLASGGHANTSDGDGKLTRQVQPANAEADRYVYDPGDPTPNPDFRESAEEARHEPVTANREDILVYTTEPLQAPLTFAGPVSAVLFASTSAKDTDWFMSLMEVNNDGKIFKLATGKVRARFRRSIRRFAPPTSTPSRTMPGV